MPPTNNQQPTTTNK